MKKISVFVLLMLFIGLSQSMAQGRANGQRERLSPEQMAQRTADNWQEQFGLSDDQHKKVYDVLLKNQEETREKLEALRANRDREGMQKMMEEQRSSVEEKVKKIFTEQQWAAFEQWKKDNPPMQRRRRGGGN